MSSWRQRLATRRFGSGLSSSPQMRSIRALCSARTAVSSTPFLRSSQSRRAPGESNPVRLPRSRERWRPATRCRSHCASARVASPIVAISSGPSSVTRSPSPRTARVADASVLADDMAPPRLTGVSPGLPWRSRNQRATNYPMKNKYMPSCTGVCLHKPTRETEKFSAREGLLPAQGRSSGDPSDAPLRALDYALETSDEDVDEVVPVGGLEAVLTQRAQELRVCDRRIVRANQHSCDRSLNIHRSCGKKQV